MNAKRITVIFYVLVMGFAIGYWAGQENAANESMTASVVVAK